MFVPFNTLPAHTRVWIYQANRPITSSEKEILSGALTAFTEQWLVHGQPMKASFEIFEGQFVVLAADEGYNAASGCSIDGSVRTLKQLGATLAIDFFDRNQVAFKNESGLFLIPLAALKQKNSEGQWHAETITFNNLVATKNELQTRWMVPAGETWLTRYMAVNTIA